ncbi:hypothetical protein Q3G72_007258 [Acer saccharum]|nr:hypothetical protein Q3G72_007258 [Acer saccharum]
MSSTSRAWMVAASVAAVEAMKDQGFCRWNYTIRSLHQHVRNNTRSASQSKKLSSSSSPSSAAAAVSTKIREVQSKKAKQSEESLRTVINSTSLTIWGGQCRSTQVERSSSSSKMIRAEAEADKQITRVTQGNHVPELLWGPNN